MQVKPPRPVLNRAHPLSRGLIGAWAMWRLGATGNEPNLARPGQFDGVPSGTISRGVTAGGLAAKYSSGAFHAMGAVGGIYPQSAYALIKWNAVSGLQEPFGRWTAAVGYNWLVYSSGSTLVLVINTNWLVGSAQLNYNPGITLSVGSLVSCLMVWETATTGWFSVNGIRSNGTTTNVGGAASASTVVQTGKNDAAPSTCDVVDARVWSRALSDAEARSLYTDPWALYRPARRTVRGVSAAEATAREAQLSTLEAVAAARRANLSSLDDEIQTLRAEIATLAFELTQRRAELASLDAPATVREAQLASLTYELAVKRAELATLEKTATERSAQLATPWVPESVAGETTYDGLTYRAYAQLFPLGLTIITHGLHRGGFPCRPHRCQLAVRGTMPSGAQIYVEDYDITYVTVRVVGAAMVRADLFAYIQHSRIEPPLRGT